MMVPTGNQAFLRWLGDRAPQELAKQEGRVRGRQRAENGNVRPAEVAAESLLDLGFNNRLTDLLMPTHSAMRVQLDPNDEESEAEPSVATEEEALRTFNRGNSMYGAGQYRQAIILWERVRQSTVIDAEKKRDMLFNIGLANMQLERYATATIYFEQYREEPGADVERAEEKLETAQIRSGAAVPAEGEGTEPEARIETEEEARKWFRRGRRWFDAGGYRKAIILWERVRQSPAIGPEIERDLLFDIGQANIELGRYATATIYFEQYLSMPGADVERGRMWLREARQAAGSIEETDSEEEMEATPTGSSVPPSPGGAGGPGPPSAAQAEDPEPTEVELVANKVVVRSYYSPHMTEEALKSHMVDAYFNHYFPELADVMMMLVGNTLIDGIMWPGGEAPEPYTMQSLEIPSNLHAAATRVYRQQVGETPTSLEDEVEEVSEADLSELAGELSKLQEHYQRPASVLDLFAALTSLDPSGVSGAAVSGAQFSEAWEQGDWLKVAEIVVGFGFGVRAALETAKLARSIGGSLGLIMIAWSTMVAVMEIPGDVSDLRWKMYYVPDISGLLASWIFGDSSLNPHAELLADAHSIREIDEQVGGSEEMGDFSFRNALDALGSALGDATSIWNEGIADNTAAMRFYQAEYENDGGRFMIEFAREILGDDADRDYVMARVRDFV